MLRVTHKNSSMERIAIAMQGIHHASGTSPVACKNAPSSTAQPASTPQITRWSIRGGSLYAYSSTASTSANAVYRRGISGNVVTVPHPQYNPPAPP